MAPCHCFAVHPSDLLDRDVRDHLSRASSVAAILPAAPVVVSGEMPAPRQQVTRETSSVGISAMPLSQADDEPPPVDFISQAQVRWQNEEVRRECGRERERERE